MPCPTCRAVIQLQGTLLFLKEAKRRKKKNQTESKEQSPHRAMARFPHTRGCFLVVGAKELPSASIHMGLCSSHPRQLSWFRCLLCFAGLMCLHLQNALMSEHPLSDQKHPAEVWRGADLGKHELSHQKISSLRLGAPKELWLGQESSLQHKPEQMAETVARLGTDAALHAGC